MRKLDFTICLLLSLLVSPAFKGTTAAEGTSPGPRGKESTTAEYSDPKKTYETYLRAIKANDLDAAKKCWSIVDNDPAGVLDVVAGLWVAAHRLGEVARHKLGPRGWAVLQEWNDIVCRSDCTDEAIGRTLRRLKDAKVETAGNKATLTIEWAKDEPHEKPVFGYAGDHPVAHFRRVKGQWKLDAGPETGLEQSADFLDPPDTWGPFRGQIEATRLIIADLEKGKLRSDEETIAAFEAFGEEDATRRKPRILGPRLDQVGVPSAVHLESGGLAKWSAPPVLAISDSGVIYVFWSAGGQKKATPSAALPLIPAKFSFGDDPEPEWSAVPGVNVRRQGVWSKPGVLVEGTKDCAACFAWCAGEKLHLLLADGVTRRTQHLLFDPQLKQWTRVAELPYRLTEYDAYRQVGETVHIGFVESTGRELGRGALPQRPHDRFVYREHTYACYLSFDGQRWSRPLRIDESHNQSRGVTRVRLAVDGNQTAHLAWWSAVSEKGTHGYAVIRDGKASYEPMQFPSAAIERDESDLGIDPQGRVIVAYKADLPEKHLDSRKIHVRRRVDGHWTGPEKIGGEGEALSGEIRVVWGPEQTLVTWIASEEYKERGGGLWKGIRRFSVDDGESWSPSRWIARFPTLRGNGVPLTALNLGICVDQDGGVHICEETRHYCHVFTLRGSRQ